jgi:hypothetical protein
MNMLIQNLNCLIGEAGVKIAQSVIPPRTLILQTLRQALLNSPLFGTPNNNSFSTWQANISSLDKELRTSLGQGATVHEDKGDDSISFAITICLSDINETVFPGGIYFAEIKSYCVMEPFSFVIFSGLEPHAGIHSVSANKPQPWERRINCVLYPRTEFMNRTKPIMYPWSNDTPAGYSFFTDGDAVLGSEANRRLWGTRELLSKFLQMIQEYGHHVTSETAQQVFELVTGSKREYIDPRSDTAKQIVSTVSKAGSKLAAYRPSLNKLTLSAKDPHTQPLDAPLNNCEHNEQNHDVGLGEGRKRKVQQHCEQRDPESRSSATNEDEQSDDMPSYDQHDQPPIQPRRASRVAQLAAIPAEKRGLGRITEGGTAGKENKTQSREGEDGGQTKRSEKRQRTMIRSRHGDKDGTLSEADICGRLTSTKLFDLIELQRTLNELTFAKHVIPRKSANTAIPAIRNSQELGFVPTAPPPPSTKGSTIVEDFLQLGEHCQWLLVAFERHGRHIRILCEKLLHNLVKVEPLLDCVALKKIFHDRSWTKESGPATHQLMQAVECMMEKSESAENHGKTFTFDAKNILKDRCLPKLCCNVSTVITPYKGKDPALHMAQHFREVRSVFPKILIPGFLSHVFLLGIGKDVE